MSSLQIENLFKVRGKVILVTGGSRGVGKMITTGFVRNGAKVCGHSSSFVAISYEGQVYICSRSAERCNSTANELNAFGGPGICIPFPADLQKLEEVDKLVHHIVSHERSLHVLVNNAGAAWEQPIDEYSDAGFSKVLNLNVQRVFTLTQKLLPLLRAAAITSKDGEIYRDPARIINIGSVEGLAVPHHETYAYSASKAALHHLSRSFGGRLGWEGITSNTIACGPFESKMTASTLANDGRNRLINAIPLRRIGAPEDVAAAAIYLASPASAYLNGATITLDGGYLISMPPSKL
ncbi:hypothetical protein HGRIS_008089 [Hohenbuehelia grisea]|uniref:Uncharacterized protein n=1 Tax=Hohenbuehelia grisea TaxID=104357 RepID=A0ABR3J6Y7_9AGAR